MDVSSLARAGEPEPGETYCRTRQMVNTTRIAALLLIRGGL